MRLGRDIKKKRETWLGLDRYGYLARFVAPVAGSSREKGLFPLEIDFYIVNFYPIIPLPSPSLCPSPSPLYRNTGMVASVGIAAASTAIFFTSTVKPGKFFTFAFPFADHFFKALASLASIAPAIPTLCQSSCHNLQKAFTVSLKKKCYYSAQDSPCPL